MPVSNKRLSGTEEAILKMVGATLQFIWRNGAVKIFAVLLMIISISLFAFSFRVSPLLAFTFLIIFCAAIVIFLMWLLPHFPELFQDSGTWLGYQELLIGDNKTGLHLPAPQSPLLQAIVQKKTISAKAKIAPPVKEQKQL